MISSTNEAPYWGSGCPTFCPASCHPSILSTKPVPTREEIVKESNSWMINEIEGFKATSNWMRSNIGENKPDYVHIPYEELPEFKFDTSEPGVETCECGNIYKRTNSCELCVGKCLGRLHCYTSYDPTHGGNTYATTCANGFSECTGCGDVPSVCRFRLRDFIPIKESCLSDCNCKTSSIAIGIIPFHDPYFFNEECRGPY